MKSETVSKKEQIVSVSEYEIERQRIHGLGAVLALAKLVPDPAAVEALRAIRDLANMAEPHQPEHRS